MYEIYNDYIPELGQYINCSWIIGKMHAKLIFRMHFFFIRFIKYINKTDKHLNY